MWYEQSVNIPDDWKHLMTIIRTGGLVIATIALLITTAMPANATYARGEY